MPIFKPDTVNIQNNASDVGNRPTVNFIPGTSIGFTISDVPASNRVNVTIDTLQSLTTSASPTFVGLTLSGLTEGSVLFAGSGGVVSQDNANLFWNNTAKTLIVGDPGTETAGIDLNGSTYNAVLKISDINGGAGNAAELILHRHSTTIPPAIVIARSNSDTSTHASVTAGMLLFQQLITGWTGSHYDSFVILYGSADTGTISSTSSPGRFDVLVTPDGSNTPAIGLTVRQNKNIEMPAYGAGVAQFSSSGVISSTAPSTSGNILQSNGTAWVSNSLSSAGIAPSNLTYMTIANESGTLANSRRIAVNATNLSGTDGGAGSAYTLNTIQDIATSSTPTFQRLILSGSTNQNFINASGTLDGTGDEIAYTLAYTTNHAVSGNDTGLLISMTDTASVGTSLPLDIQVGGVSKLSVTEAGLLTTVNATISSMTLGSVLFAGTGGAVSQSNSDFFWDNTNKYLGIGTASPSDFLHVYRASTATSGTLNNARFQSVPDPTSASSAVFRAGDFTCQLGNTGATNVTGGIVVARYLGGNARQTGTLTAMVGLQLQAINGIVFGASSGTALTSTLQAAVFQAVNNSQTTGAIAEITGGVFTSEQRGTGGATVTLQQAGMFYTSIAGGTTTNIYGIYNRTSTVYGSTYTGGTITNVSLYRSEGFPAGPTYTNTPQQILLDAGTTACIAIRQQGASNTSRFQGAVNIGADAAPTASYALTLTGNLTTSATIFNFTTVTSLTFQDALARSRLYMDATSTTISTVPVSITPTANIGTGVSLTTTTPAHTGLTVEQQELLIDMSSTKTWNAGATVATQRSLYIKAPSYNGTVTTTWTEACTVAISGPPTIPGGGAAAITTSIGFKMEQRAVSNLIQDAIGFVIYGPTGAFGSNTCGAFMNGNVGINTLSPKAYLDIKPTGLLSSAAQTCIDGTTRYANVYIGGTQYTSVTASGAAMMVLDHGVAYTSNTAYNQRTQQVLFTLGGSVNYTGTVTVNNAGLTNATSGGTLTSGIAFTGAINTSSVGAMTTGRSINATLSIGGTGINTTMVLYDTSSISYSNVAGTTTNTYGVRISDVSKGVSYTLTDFYGVRIEDQTAIFGGVKVGYYQAGSNLHNRLVGKTRLGSDATPVVMADINGGLSINSSGSTVSLTADNQVVTVGDRSYIRLSSNNATATNRTFVLTQSTRDGHILVLEWTGTNAGELVDDSAQNGGGNHRLAGTWTPTQYDTLTLISNATDWVELARSVN